MSAQVNLSFFNSNRKAFEQKQTLNAKTLVAIKWRREQQQQRSPNGFGTKIEKKTKHWCFFWDAKIGMKMEKNKSFNSVIWKLLFFCLFVCFYLKSSNNWLGPKLEWKSKKTNRSTVLFWSCFFFVCLFVSIWAIIGLVQNWHENRKNQMFNLWQKVFRHTISPSLDLISITLKS